MVKKSCSIDHHPEIPQEVSGHGHSHHGHLHSHSAELRPAAIKKLRLTLLVGLALIVLELLGGWLSGSLALMADAVHVIADTAALGITLIASWFAARPHSQKRSYGYYRLEVLAAFINGLLLVALVFFIWKEAYERFHRPEEIHSKLMLGISILGLLINLFMLLILKPIHVHNMNVRGAYLHIVGDTLSSTLIIAGAFLIMVTGMVWIDVAASVVVGLIIIALAFRLIWDAVHVLLEGTPRHIDPIEIQDRLRKEFPEIVNIHDFHVWEITTHWLAMTAHIDATVTSLEQSRALIEGMNAAIEKHYGIRHTTFQVEAVSKT